MSESECDAESESECDAESESESDAELEFELAVAKMDDAQGARV